MKPRSACDGGGRGRVWIPWAPGVVGEAAPPFRPPAQRVTRRKRRRWYERRGFSTEGYAVCATATEGARALVVEPRYTTKPRPRSEQPVKRPPHHMLHTTCSTPHAPRGNSAASLDRGPARWAGCMRTDTESKQQTQQRQRTERGEKKGNQKTASADSSADSGADSRQDTAHARPKHTIHTLT